MTEFFYFIEYLFVEILFVPLDFLRVLELESWGLANSINLFFNRLLISVFIVFISTSSYSGSDDILVLQEELDMVLMNDPCFDQLQSDIDEDSNLTSVIRQIGRAHV